MEPLSRDFGRQEPRVQIYDFSLFHRVWTTTQSLVWHHCRAVLNYRIEVLTSYLASQHLPTGVSTPTHQGGHSQAFTVLAPPPGGYRLLLILLHSPQSYSVSYPFTLNTLITHSFTAWSRSRSIVCTRSIFPWYTYPVPRAISFLTWRVGTPCTDSHCFIRYNPRRAQLDLSSFKPTSISQTTPSQTRNYHSLFYCVCECLSDVYMHSGAWEHLLVVQPGVSPPRSQSFISFHSQMFSRILPVWKFQKLPSLHMCILFV